MFRYRVEDLENLFAVYGLNEEEERHVRERFDAGDELYVYSDGAVRAESERDLIEPVYEEVPEACFDWEAARAGSVIELMAEDDEEEEEDLGYFSGIDEDEEGITVVLDDLELDCVISESVEDDDQVEEDTLSMVFDGLPLTCVICG